MTGGVRNCREVQERLGPGQDGERLVVVDGKEISVYCHGMDTSNPREFISLTKTEMMDNYSEIFSRRLLRPEKCSPRHSRNTRTGYHQTVMRLTQSQLIILL